MSARLSHILGLCASLSVLAQPAQSNAFAEAMAAARSGQAAQAVQMFRRLADEHSGPAQFNLAVLYALGSGVTQNDETALYWAWKSRFSGVTKAEHLTNYLGRGTPRALLDKVQDRLHEDLLAEVNSGNKNSILALGRVFLELSEEAEHEQALVWFTMAAALQVPHASKWRDVTSGKLSREDRLKAQERAASLFQQWCDRHGAAHTNLCSVNS
jgi:TPR repeat protein